MNGFVSLRLNEKKQQSGVILKMEKGKNMLPFTFAFDYKNQHRCLNFHKTETIQGGHIFSFAI